MRRKTGFFSNHQLLIDGNEIVGVEYDRYRIMRGERVKIQGDSHGYISPSITKEGYGTVVDITDKYTDHYFGVMMDNGQYGHVKIARIAMYTTTL